MTFSFQQLSYLLKLSITVLGQRQLERKLLTLKCSKGANRAWGMGTSIRHVASNSNFTPQRGRLFDSFSESGHSFRIKSFCFFVIYNKLVSGILVEILNRVGHSFSSPLRYKLTIPLYETHVFPDNERPTTIASTAKKIQRARGKLR